MSHALRSLVVFVGLPTLTNNRINESPCADNSTFRNNTLNNSTQTVCQ